MSGQWPKSFIRAQVVAMLNMLNEEDSGRSNDKDQENNCNWEISVLEEELSSEDEVENATNDASITLLVTSNSDQSPVSSNPSITDRTAVEETANDGTKWVFRSFGSNERRRRAMHNVLTEESDLFRRSRQMSDPPSDAFQLLLNSHIISLIQNCTNVEARNVLYKDDWSVSGFERPAFIALCVFIALCAGSIRRKKYFFRQLLEQTWGFYSFQRLWLQIVFERSYDLCALMSAAPGQYVCKLTSLL